MTEVPGPSVTADVYDMHAHLGFYEDVAHGARELAGLGVHALCATSS